MNKTQKGRKEVHSQTLLHMTPLHHNTFYTTIHVFDCVFNTGLHSTSYKARLVVSKFKLDDRGSGEAKLAGLQVPGSSIFFYVPIFYIIIKP